MGDGLHAFGHGPTCYWCGLDGDDPAIEKPCDERKNRQPSEASMRHFECTSAIEDARYELEQAELTCEKRGYRATAKALYSLRLQLSQVLREHEVLHPTDEKPEGGQ